MLVNTMLQGELIVLLCILYSTCLQQIEEFSPDLSKYFLQCHEMKGTQSVVSVGNVVC